MSSISASEREVSAFLTFRQSGWPQLKVIGGELQQTNSKYTIGGILGEQLNKTVEKIKTIVTNSLNSLESKLQDFDAPLYEGDKKKIASFNTELRKAWIHSVEVFFALLYFRNTYIVRYQSAPGHPGIGDLHTMYDNFCFDWISIISRFSISFCSIRPTILTKVVSIPSIEVRKDEIEALINFPTSNCDQLKVFNGYLMQASSGFSLWGTKLDGTVKRISEILWHQLKTIHRLLLQNSPAGRQNSELSDEWQTCGQLFLGFTYFKKLYMDRYKEEPNHPGLSSLEPLYEEFLVNWLQLAHIYNSTHFVSTWLNPIQENPVEVAPKVEQRQEESEFIIIPPSQQEPPEPREGASVEQQSLPVDEEFVLLSPTADSNISTVQQVYESRPEESENSKLAKFYQTMFDALTEWTSNQSSISLNPSLQQSHERVKMYKEIGEIFSCYREKKQSMAPFLDICSKIFFDQFLLYSTTEFMTDKVIMPQTKKFFLKGRDNLIAFLPGWIEAKRAKGIARIFDKGMRLSKIRAVIDAVQSRLIPIAKDKPSSIWLVHYGHRCIISIAQHISIVASDLSYILGQVSTARKERKRVENKAPRVKVWLDRLIDPVCEVENSLRRDITARVAETAARNFIYYAIYFSVAFLLNRGLRMAGGEVLRCWNPLSAEASTELFMAALWYGCWLPFLFSHAFSIIPVVRKTNADFKEKFTEKRSLLENLAALSLLEQATRK